MQATKAFRERQTQCAPAVRAALTEMQQGGNWQTLRAHRKRLTLNTVHKNSPRKPCGGIGASDSSRKRTDIYREPATHRPHGADC